MSKNILLSICIPVYNRINIFINSLTAAAMAVSDNIDDVEIVVSDNASEDDIADVVEKVRGAFPNVRIKYFRNEVNLGLAGNFLKVVDKAEGEYCWIVGSDDFVLKKGVQSILRIVSENNDIDFISVGFGAVDISDMPNNLSVEGCKEYLYKYQDPSKWKLNKAPIENRRMNKWDELVDPKYNNVLLGSMMVGIFRRTLWNSVDKSVMRLNGSFNNIENTYPHCYIYSKCMSGKPAWYYGYPAVIVGSGARDWAGETGVGFWNSSLPIIHLKILTEIAQSYEIGGINSSQAKRCRKWAAYRSGSVLLPYLIYRYIFRKKVKSQEEIEISKIISYHKTTLSFYGGMLMVIPRYLKIVIRSYINNK